MANDNKIKNETIKIVIIVMAIFSVIILLIGITFAVYRNFVRGKTDNIIEAGEIAFSYDEAMFDGNGVKIENAMPMSDSAGMRLKSTREYFDFSVSAHTTIEDIYYEVVAIKQDGSTLDEQFVKIYVTTKDGSVEKASPLVMLDNKVRTYNQLENSQNNEGKVVYTSVVNKGINYYQDFRLRLWIAEDLVLNDDYLNKTFSVKIKVNAIEM